MRWLAQTPTVRSLRSPESRLSSLGNRRHQSAVSAPAPILIPGGDEFNSRGRCPIGVNLSQIALKSRGAATSSSPWRASHGTK
jgi:hypothetical protein